MPSLSAQYSIILRVEIDHRPGMLGRVATAIGDAGGSIGSIDPVCRRRPPHAPRHHRRHGGRGARRRVGRRGRRSVDGARLIDTTDRTFLVHVGGKIEQRNKLPAPHARRPEHGLHARRRPRLHGDRPRPRQGLPVHDQAQHRGRRLRRQRRARPRRHRPRGRDARDGGQVRRCSRSSAASTRSRSACRTKDPDEIVAAVNHIAPAFGGINLEDISAPRCFEIEERLKQRRSTSRSSTTTSTAPPWSRSPRCSTRAKLTGKRLEDLHVLIVGLGAAGDRRGEDPARGGRPTSIIGCDSRGALHTERRRLPRRLDAADEALVRRAHEPRAARRRRPPT